MIVISGFMELADEDLEEFMRLSAELSVASRAETGCADYRFARSIEDPSRFEIFEEWADEDALARHAGEEHYRSWKRAVRGLQVRRMGIVQYVGDQREVLV